MELDAQYDGKGMASYLIFHLNRLDFAVDTMSVREVVWLPKLTPVEEVPHYVVGMMNLRGVVVPVIDLTLRFGHPSQSYRPDNKVVVLEHESRLVGLIVDNVSDVAEVSVSEIADAPVTDYKQGTHSNCVCGEIKLDERIIMQLSAEVICDLELEDDPSLPAETDSDEDRLVQCRAFAPEASEEELQLFQKRASELVLSPEAEGASEDRMLAVVGINKELFGIELDLIREFTEIGHVVPIPCVPRHIVGDMNLRGEILTLVDIKGLIGVPEYNGVKAAKLIVVAMQDQIIGIPIDEVHDLIAVSSGMSMTVGNENYLKGSVEYDRQMLGVLDIEQIMAADELVVNELL